MTTEKHYPYFGIPPPKTPRPAAEEPTLRGKRVILSQPYGFVYDQRATREPYTNPHNGKQVVDICTEAHWYRWMYTGAKPERQQYPLNLVWVEG